MKFGYEELLMEIINKNMIEVMNLKALSYAPKLLLTCIKWVKITYTFKSEQSGQSIKFNARSLSKLKDK